MSQLNRSSVIALIGVAVFAVSAYISQSEIMRYVRVVLEEGYLRMGIILMIFTIVTVHVIKIKSKFANKVFVVESGFTFLDGFLTFGTYSAVTTTACSLLEGAVIQQFFGDIIYFSKFNQVDIYVLLGVSGLLLWYVILHMYILARELLFKNSSYEVVNEELLDSENITK